LVFRPLISEFEKTTTQSLVSIMRQEPSHWLREENEVRTGWGQWSCPRRCA
jgi:hypothetical protein